MGFYSFFVFGQNVQQGNFKGGDVELGLLGGGQTANIVYHA